MMYRASISPDPFTVLAAVDGVAGGQGIPWFLCGGFSRVLLCEEVLKIPVGRATYDLDIAVRVASLEAFLHLRDALCGAPGFRGDRRVEHRVVHENGIRVDIIPFGDVAGPGERFPWGEDGGFEMNVTGFADAWASAVDLLLNGALHVRVAGYAEQFVLKLMAWKDRHATRGAQEASDLAYFLKNAFRAVSEDDLYRNYEGLLQETGYDVDLAACFVLGRRIGTVFSRNTADTVLDLLRNELRAGEASALLSDMYDAFILWRHPEERVTALLRLLVRGVSREESPPGA